MLAYVYLGGGFIVGQGFQPSGKRYSWRLCSLDRVAQILRPTGERSKKKMLAYVYLGGGFIVETHVAGMVVLCRNPLLAAAAWLIPALMTNYCVCLYGNMRIEGVG